MNIRKKSFFTLCLALSSIMIVGLSSGAEELSGLQLMKMVDERDDGEDQTSKATFELINKRNQKRIRETVRVWKDYEGQEGYDAKMITFFESPPDVKGTGFMSWSYEDQNKDDDQWLYLPALRKVRLIASSDKGKSFMGSDFTYDDMGDRKVEQDTHTLLKTENLNNRECYVVESVPIEKRYIYSKKVTWVDKKNLIPVKVEYFDRKKRHLKTLETEWQQVNNIWTWKRSVMSNHLTRHQTIIEIKEVELNKNVSDSIFNKRTLEKGIH
ncbi:outer membrane lipoprotein-sorting protein [candidate division CSSED10-310 bacterium]|uniref:Outer membrane lipoprotein-sorting protein n=1 Tax=candidate division CSSED10-310 bacterium TaxID=2855610 RepID=A0ABV6Z4K5_UNCC1